MRKIERIYGWKDGEAAVAGEMRDGRLVMKIDGTEHEFAILSAEGGLFRFGVDGSGHPVQAFAAIQDKKIWVQIDGRVHLLERRAQRRRTDGGGKAALGPIEAPMFGTVRKLLVEPGAIVEEGQGLVVIEAMKMELTLRAPAAGRVAAVPFAEGARVDQGEALVVLAPVEQAAGEADVVDAGAGEAAAAEAGAAERGTAQGG